MDYNELIEGANQYGVGDNIYDLAFLMVSKHGTFSKEAIAGIFVLIFSWNRDFYSPPQKQRKPIDVLDQHVKEFEETLGRVEKHISALKSKNIEDVDYNERLESVDTTVENAILHTFSRFRAFLGPTGASKAFHLLLPRLIVMWDTQIRIDYGISSDATDFLTFQKMMRQLVDDTSSDFVKKHENTKPSDAIKEFLQLRYGTQPKSICKLLDEFNWATKGQSKRGLLSNTKPR